MSVQFRKKNKEDKISKPTIEATNVISDSVVQKVEEDSHDNKSVSDMSKDDCDLENNPSNLTYAEAVTSATIGWLVNFEQSLVQKAARPAVEKRNVVTTIFRKIF